MQLPTETPPASAVKNLFVDLDETLFHCYHLEKTWDKEYFPEVSGCDILVEGDPYPITLRPGAKEFLTEMRKLGRVYVCTRALRCYGMAISEHYNLGFTEDIIFDRKIVKDCRNFELPIPKGKVVLFDDLPKEENWEKIKLLSQLGPVRYVRVEPYEGFINQAFTPEIIAEYVKFVTEM